MLGQDHLHPVESLAALSEKMRKKEFNASFTTFTNAIETGNATLDEHADEFESEESPDSQIISIADARELGIMPIASAH